MNFNQLTDAETERLSILLEELGEAQQAVGKILRHGYESFDPTIMSGPAPSNRSNLEKELGDVSFIVELMCKRHDIDKPTIRARRLAKAIKIEEYLHHQGKL